MLDVAADNGYSYISDIHDAGDVNRDGIHDLDVRYRLLNGTGSLDRWRRLILFGSHRLRSETVGSAIAHGRAKMFPVNRGIATERYVIGSPAADVDGDGIPETIATADDRVEAHFACTDSPGCISIYTASQLIVGHGGLPVFTYGEDWGYNQTVYNLDRPLSSAGWLRRFGEDDRPAILFSSPTGGVRIFEWIAGKPRQQAIEVRPGPIAMDVNGDGRDEVVGVSARAAGTIDGRVGISIVTRLDP